MAYQAFALPGGRIEIHCALGEITQIVRHDDGRWSVEEDEQHRMFHGQGVVLDCAREIGGDPDYAGSIRRLAAASPGADAEAYNHTDAGGVIG